MPFGEEVFAAFFDDLSGVDRFFREAADSRWTCFHFLRDLSALRIVAGNALSLILLLPGVAYAMSTQLPAHGGKATKGQTSAKPSQHTVAHNKHTAGHSLHASHAIRGQHSTGGGAHVSAPPFPSAGTVFHGSQPYTDSHTSDRGGNSCSRLDCDAYSCGVTLPAPNFTSIKPGW